VLLSNSPTIDLKQLQNVKFKENQFLFLGFVFLNEGRQVAPKIKTLIQCEYFQKFFKQNEWIDVYIHPIEKISSQIREYQSILNLQMCELSKFVYQPQ
jgi:hypothetical protein